jgi:transcriptional regulator with XRE-family HTH domain
MALNPSHVGEQIAAFRKSQNMTQSELGEKLNISYQAVSKWERGETLPDTSILPELAMVLDTTIDNILIGSEKALQFKGKREVADMIEGINCLERVGLLIGKQTMFYRQLIEGLSEKMNTDIETMLNDDFLREILISEVIIQNIMLGYYFDMAKVKSTFKHDKCYSTVAEYAKRYGMI